MTRVTDPTVQITRTETGRGLRGAKVRLLFVTCPHCGREHMHGGGDTTGPVIDGHRHAHCQKGGYYIDQGDARA